MHHPTLGVHGAPTKKKVVSKHFSGRIMFSPQSTREARCRRLPEKRLRLVEPPLH
jgi:hypothetical protein